MTNRLFYGDNLEVRRRKIASASVDLCYIDPPFNSKRNYFQIYTNQGGEGPGAGAGVRRHVGMGPDAAERID